MTLISAEYFFRKIYVFLPEPNRKYVYNVTMDRNSVVLSQVEKAKTAEYGATLVGTYMGCHGDNLGGAMGVDGVTWASNLTSHENGFAGKYDIDALINTLRTGQSSDERTLDVTQMPYQYLGQMDDIELSAIYAYLQSAEPANNPQP